MPSGIGDIEPGTIQAEYFSDGSRKGLRFGIGDLSFLYLKGTDPATCWGVVYEKPVKIPASGLLANLIGPQLTLRDMRVGSISGQFDEAQRNTMIGQIDQARFLLGAEGPSPTGFVAGITIEGIGPKPVVLPFAPGKTEKKADAPIAKAPAGSAKEEPKAPAAGGAAEAMRKWFAVDKTIGPLHLGRVGCEWKNGKIGLLLDSDIQAGGLHLGLTGLRVSLPPFDLKPENLELGLDGIDVSYRGGPVSISGAFFRNEITIKDRKSVQYDGMALIKAADFTITGLGSYAFVDNKPSLFIFAILHKTLGGPVFFRVNGLAAGFGYNRTLKLPPIEEVHNFPLVRASLEEDYFKGKSIQDAMFMLREYIQPSPGDYWFAVGIRFSSFEMVLSFALLSVSFGREVEIALLGVAKMTIPRDAAPGKAIAYAELALRAVIRPEEGTIMVEGRLSNESYIFSRDCHLTGGFAFYLWLSGPHAGDFVITLGGYHPKFVRPGHYPVVPAGHQLAGNQGTDDHLGALLCHDILVPHGRGQALRRLPVRLHQGLVHCLCGFSPQLETALLHGRHGNLHRGGSQAEDTPWPLHDCIFDLCPSERRIAHLGACIRRHNRSRPLGHHHNHPLWPGQGPAAASYGTAVC